MSDLKIQEMDIDKIEIGDRIRKDLGDIDELAKSIESVDLLHPVVVTPGGRLIDGYRRIEASKRLHRTSIPVHVVDLSDPILGEHAANRYRKDLTPSEKVAIAKELRKREEQAAKERQREGGRAGGKASGKLPEASKGETRERVAGAVGMSSKTLEKAEAIVGAAEEDPDLYGPIKEEMDRTGKVAPAFTKLKRMRDDTHGGRKEGHFGTASPQEVHSEDAGDEEDHEIEPEDAAGEEDWDDDQPPAPPDHQANLGDPQERVSRAADTSEILPLYDKILALKPDLESIKARFWKIDGRPWDRELEAVRANLGKWQAASEFLVALSEEIVSILEAVEKSTATVNRRPERKKARSNNGEPA